MRQRESGNEVFAGVFRTMTRTVGYNLEKDDEDNSDIQSCASLKKISRMNSKPLDKDRKSVTSGIATSKIKDVLYQRRTILQFHAVAEFSKYVPTSSLDKNLPSKAYTRGSKRKNPPLSFHLLFSVSPFHEEGTHYVYTMNHYTPLACAIQTNFYTTQIQTQTQTRHQHQPDLTNGGYSPR